MGVRAGHPEQQPAHVTGLHDVTIHRLGAEQQHLLSTKFEVPELAG